jgi:hypothetical protein
VRIPYTEEEGFSREKGGGTVSQVIFFPDEEIPITVLSTSTSFHHPGLLRYGGVVELMLEDFPRPDFTTDGTEVSGVGPVCRDADVSTRGISAAVHKALADELAALKILGNSVAGWLGHI